jgi:hypothetical protein
MSTGAPSTTVFESAASLRAAGFDGLVAIADLRRSGSLEVPVENGVYVVLRLSPEAPAFMERSAGGHYRGVDPSLKIEALTERWVPGAIVLFIGCAAGTGVRGKLQQRIKRYVRFGQGAAIASGGGDLAFQLRDHSRLAVAWKPTADAELEQARLQYAFTERYGAPPFAQPEQESDE